MFLPLDSDGSVDAGRAVVVAVAVVWTSNGAVPGTVGSLALLVLQLVV